MELLTAARRAAPSGWYIGAGVIRNLVWDHLHGFTTPTPPRDVDLIYHDPTEDHETAEKEHEDRLTSIAPGYLWEVKNQATVHFWYASKFGHAITPIASVSEAVGRFPETCTSVAVTLDADGRLDVLAPCGLADLFGLVLRRNPAQVTYDLFLSRLRDKRIQERWPNVTVVYEGKRTDPA